VVAPAVAGGTPHTSASSSAPVSALILDKDLPSSQVEKLPLKWTVTEPLRRWIVPLKLSPEP
jgi:hypothetical protein